MNGLIGKKIGMTQLFDEVGNVIPVSVIEAGPCTVAQIKTAAKEGYNALQVGFGKAKHLNRPQKGHLKELSACHLREFKVDKPEDYKVGQEIKTDVFTPGDEVEVSGISIGKGFAGTVKRHHHHRGPMAHGSKSHRIPGSIGAGTTPGRVFKGRGMPGHMGHEMVTVKGLKVVRIDADKNLVLLRGAVPGKPGSILVIRKIKSAKEKGKVKA